MTELQAFAEAHKFVAVFFVNSVFATILLYVVGERALAARGDPFKDKRLCKTCVYVFLGVCFGLFGACIGWLAVQLVA